DIQGNVLAGFSKDHRTLLGLAIGDPAQAKKWVGLISDQVSTMYEVHNHNKAYKSVRGRLKGEPIGLVATWMNIGFSYPAMSKLIKDMEEIDPYLDSSYKNGLILSSQSLGDPVDPLSPGNYHKWKVGSQDNSTILDILIIIDSDDPGIMDTQAKSILNQSNSFDLRNVYYEVGHDLSYFNEEKRGHEHFGFKDGISQPGVRGRLSDNPTDYLTPRPHLDPPDNPYLIEYDLNGRPLIAPGEFVIGYPTQNLNYPRNPNPPDPSIPKLLRNGSYLVFRRLRQDVQAFEDFVSRESKKISQVTGFLDMTAEKFKSLLVGRWPSGAPLSLSPDKDDLQLAKDKSRNNMFGYANDQHGYNTPIISHIRKVNPRDLDTDQGSAVRTLKRRIIRRGLPFGAPLDLSKRDPIRGDRGLLFLSYQTSISEQFEFLAKCWMNMKHRPTNAPSTEGHFSGYDLLVGQNSKNDNRIRDAYLQANIDNQTAEAQVTTMGLSILDWVIPTGGGYFFSPSISTLRSILGGT
ncbi:MAG: Dyp-type peroxidase, partial [Nitrososphaeraceae archaeon]